MLRFNHRVTLAVPLVSLALTAVLGAAAGAQPSRAHIQRIGGVPARAPHATPAIFKINLPSHQIHSGDVVHASVITSSNVASVEARIKGYGMNLQHVGIGKFAIVYQVPWLPFFLKGNWPVNLIARNMDGVQTEKTLYIQYQ
jgi:hypothetical protein